MKPSKAVLPKNLIIGVPYRSNDFIRRLILEPRSAEEQKEIEKHQIYWDETPHYLNNENNSTK